MNHLTRKIIIAFCLVSVIPGLIFVYLVLPKFLPALKYPVLIPAVVSITLIIIVLGFSLLVNIGRKIIKLSASADVIAKGDLNHKIQVTGSNEVVELSSSLNQITRKLREDMNLLETRAILIERTNKELDRINKLKSEFVSMVSHELRAPLINIKQTASSLLSRDNAGIGAEEEKSLGIVYHNSERLLKLISDLLDVSKIEAGEMKLNRETLDIGKLILEAAESLARWRESKHIELNLEVVPALPYIYADSDRISQVLVNLFSNAIKFTPAGGEIGVKAELDRRGSFLEVSVKDTGVGIPAEQLDAVFERFKQANDSNTYGKLGTGLGLSITKEIVRMHGGKIWVESKQGQGAKFTFSLPRYSEEEILQQGIEDRILESQGKDKEFSVLIFRLNTSSLLRVEPAETRTGSPLLKIVEALKNTVRRGDYVFRNGEDEIIVLAQANRQEVPKMAVRLKNTVKKSIPAISEGLKADFSYGFATYPKDADNAQDLMAEAYKSCVNEAEERLRKNIMLVDDEFATVEALKKLLSKLGYSNFSEAYDGNQALVKLKTSIPDLLILDVRMPKMNGYELIGRLKENIKTKDLPILIMSGHSVEIDRLKEYTKQRAIPMVSKPLNIEQLKTQINYLL